MSRLFSKTRLLGRCVSLIVAMVMLFGSTGAVAAELTSGYEDILNLGVVNFQSEWGDREANIAEMERIIGEAAAAGVQMLLFPETSVTGYRDSKLNAEDVSMLVQQSDTIPGATSERFAELAKANNMYIIYGDTETISGDDQHAYNTAVIVGPNGYIGKYRKIHPVEGEWCLPGNEPAMFETPWGPVGVSICYDSFATPELARIYAASGCRLILNPTASSRGYSPDAPDDSDSWEWYYRARLEAMVDREGVFVASANLVGVDGMKDYDGNSPGLFPGGSVIMGPETVSDTSGVDYYAGSTDDKTAGFSFAQIDLSSATRDYFYTLNWRPDLYSAWYDELTQVYNPDVAQRPLPMDNEVTIGVVNFEPVWGDKAANIESMKEYIDEAAEEGVELLVFPETALTGHTYTGSGKDSMQALNAETIPGSATDELISYAIDNEMYIVFGMPELRDGQVYNSAAVLMPDGTVGSYGKINLDGDESQWSARGSKPYMFDTPWGPIGISMSDDTYSVPELARYYAAKGARIIINPQANHPDGTDEKWEWFYKNRIESTADREQIILVNSNLTGMDGNDIKSVMFPGGSSVVGTNITSPNYFGTEISSEPGLTVAENVSVGEPAPGARRLVGFTITGFNPKVFADNYAILANGNIPVIMSSSENNSGLLQNGDTTEPVKNNNIVYILLCIAAIVVIVMATKRKAPVAVPAGAGDNESGGLKEVEQASGESNNT